MKWPQPPSHGAEVTTHFAQHVESREVYFTFFKPVFSGNTLFLAFSVAQSARFVVVKS